MGTHLYVISRFNLNTILKAIQKANQPFTTIPHYPPYTPIKEYNNPK
jgi:hypothetical protein